MKKYIAIAVLMLGFSTLSSAQKIKCDDLEFANQASCNTYNTMVAAGDRDFSALASGLENSYVCFEDDDTFFTLFFSEPRDFSWRKLPNQPEYEQLGSAQLNFYRSGISDTYRSVYFSWLKVCIEGTCSSPTVMGKEKARALVSIEASEVDFSYNYKTVAGKEANKSVAIRRSTNMFVDEVQVVDEKKPLTLRSTGKCYAFPQRRPEYKKASCSSKLYSYPHSKATVGDVQEDDDIVILNDSREDGFIKVKTTNEQVGWFGCYDDGTAQE